MKTSPNRSPQAMQDGRASSAVAVHAASRRWIGLVRLGVVERLDVRVFYYFTVVVLAAAMLGCSKQAPPQSEQSQQMGLHISPPPPGAEPYAFILILTNSQPPPMRSLIAITQTKNFEWHKVAADGTATTVRGVVPTDIYDVVMTEWRTMSGKTSIDSTREQAAYIGSVDGVHPLQVQRLLDYLSK
jgi:hypothetical protein